MPPDVCCLLSDADAVPGKRCIFTSRHAAEHFMCRSDKGCLGMPCSVSISCAENIGRMSRRGGKRRREGSGIQVNPEAAQQHAAGWLME